MHWHKNFDLNTEHPGTVLLAGGGGKTTLMYALAAEAAGAGLSAACTTTTRIFRPDEQEKIVVESVQSAADALPLPRGSFLVAGKTVEALKFSAPDPLLWHFLEAQMDGLYVEADGSRMLPLKYPRADEPVLPNHYDRIFVLAGISALHRRLEQVCQRWEDFAERFHVDARTFVDAALMARILLAGYAHLQPVFVLNQADTEADAAAAREVAAELMRQGGAFAHICSLHRGIFWQ